MRWKVGAQRVGDAWRNRRRNVFAWLPCKVGDTLVWLEWVEIREHWAYDPPFGGRWIEYHRGLL